MEPTAVPAISAGILASFLAGLGSSVGALPIFLKADWGQRGQSLLLAVAGGIMLAATVFSLIMPAIDMVEARTGDEVAAAGVGVGGVLLGAVAIWLIHGVVPHEHFIKGPEGGSLFTFGRNWLFIAAITLHNFPEGMSVGVAFGPGTLEAGLPVAIGIGIQNMPEGLAVAAALLSEGFSRTRAALVALFSGLVEPVGGALGAVVVGVSDALLPWGLAFSAGAMLFVIVGEVIPETYKETRTHGPTMVFVGGFLLMMILDVTLG